jgi:hypothetical protein
MNTDPSASSGPFPPREERSHSLVLVCGLATTVLALLGVYLLDANTEDFHIMGWYANYILPIGAVIVGVVASSGYGLASWFSGIKITRSLLGIVLALQLAAYFGAQYIEFKGLHLVHPDGNPVGFIEYFDVAARSMCWKQNNGQMGEALGMWGYAIRGLEILGFAGGGLIVPLVLRKAPYCQACQRYMRTRNLGLVAASVPVRKVKKSDVAGQAALEAEQQQAFDSGKRTVEKLQQHATGNQAPDFSKLLAELAAKKKQTTKLHSQFSLHLVYCRRCHAGWLRTDLLVGQGQQMKQTEIARADLHPEFVRAIS